MASQGHASIQLRLKHDLKARVVASAKANNRSINAEIAFQLQRSYYQAPLNAAYFGPNHGVWKDRDDDRMDSMAGNS
jgi:hypothetical protein